jgi:hypothetical protein
LKNLYSLLNNTKTALKSILRYKANSERELLLLGKLLSLQIISKQNIKNLNEVEFKVFSQWGDDGIIQWLISKIDIEHKTFIEFGAGDYRESNTRFLMMNNNWSGLVMDMNKNNVTKIINSEYYWKYDLNAKSVFINTEDINSILTTSGFEKNVGILHIDLDGIDYWVWKAIDSINPIIVILEYNSIFGVDRSITIPYDKNFIRTKAHHSNLYFGASLKALDQLSISKGYTLIGCNSAGNNAYFVRNDKLNNSLPKITLQDGFVLSKFRESRDLQGKLSYLYGTDRLKILEGMPVYNCDLDVIEKL